MAAPPRHVIAGVDEAGLGPMLGPLCIGVSAFEAPFNLTNPYDLWTPLSALVSADPKTKARKIVVCDSKKLHSSAKGVRNLEESLLPFLGNLAVPSASFRALWQQHALAPLAVLKTLPWYANAEFALPLAGHADKIEIRRRKLADAFKHAEIKPLRLAVLPVVVPEFNRLIDQHRNKSDVNLSAFCAVVSGLWQAYSRLSVACDRLGARAYYADALRTFFGVKEIEIKSESETRSAYILRDGPERELKISFRVAADVDCFPVALASMLAKYTRELCMEAFNAYFVAQQPGLKPTKGYVTDARRWLEDSAVMREVAEVDQRLLIRAR